MAGYVNQWWERAGGGREVLRLALPLVISTSSWTLMQFVDRLFLTWYSPDALAASLPAGLLSFTIICFFLGVAFYVNTFVAQYFGAKRFDRIGPVVWQGIGLGVFCTPMVLATVPAAPLVFSWFGHTPTVLALEVSYYHSLAYGAGPLVIAGALGSFFTGRGDSRTVMRVDVLANSANIALDYLLIYGIWVFTEMGIAGAGIATSIAQWAKTLILLWPFLLPQFRVEYNTLAWRFDAAIMRRLLYFGAPAGMQFLLEVGGFNLFVQILGRLGALELAASSLAFNVSMLAFLPMFGMGMAVTTLVGQHLGEDNPEVAARCTWTGFWISAAYMLGGAGIFLAFPDLLLAGHRWGTDPAEFAALRDIVVVLLRFVAVYVLFDAMNLIFVAALKGAGDTRFVMYVSGAMAALPAPLAWIGIEFGLGLLFCWTVITVWVCLLGLIFLGRFLAGNWRQMRVIEPEVTALDPELAGLQLHSVNKVAGEEGQQVPQKLAPAAGE